MSINAGGRIWRLVEVSGENKIPVRHKFEETDRGTWVFRAIMSPSGFYRVNTDSASGLVCFCNVPIPDDFTYFEVMSAAEKYCVATPVCGSLQILLDQYNTDNERMAIVDAGISRTVKKNPRKLVEMLGVERIAKVLSQRELLDLIELFYERRYNQDSVDEVREVITTSKLIEKVKELKDGLANYSNEIDPENLVRKRQILEFQKDLHAMFSVLKGVDSP